MSNSPASLSKECFYDLIVSSWSSPRNRWHGNYRILFGRIVNCIAYFFSSLQLHINSMTVNICICLHLWWLSSEICHYHLVEDKSQKNNCPASIIEFFFDLECNRHSIAVRHVSWIIWTLLHASSHFITHPSCPRNFNTLVLERLQAFCQKQKSGI